MTQGPDIGKAIFEHTSDSHVVELPFGLGGPRLLQSRFRHDGDKRIEARIELFNPP